MRKLRLRRSHADSPRRGCHGSHVGAAKDTSGAGEPGAKDFCEPNSPGAILALGSLGAAPAPARGCPFRLPEGPGDAVTRTPARSAARAPGASEAPRTPWEPRRGLEEGRDERDLSEFIIDCESHHPLSGALKETMAGLGRCISKRAGPGTTPLAP